MQLAQLLQHMHFNKQTFFSNHNQIASSLTLYTLHVVCDEDVFVHIGQTLVKEIFSHLVHDVTAFEKMHSDGVEVAVHKAQNSLAANNSLQ